MRVSLTVRYVSHPTIHFDRSARRNRPRLGLARPHITYHRPRAVRHGLPTIAALRAQTARYRFRSVGTTARAGNLRAAQPLGQPRVRRA